MGIRPGEKLHEEMITESDSLNTLDCGKYYVITPSHTAWNRDEYMRVFKAKFVKPGFRYSSGENEEWLTSGELRLMIQKHVDPLFGV